MADKENQFQGVVESLLKGMDTVLSTKTVVGEATQIGDTIILPLVDVSFGVGAGSGSNGEKNSSPCNVIFWNIVTTVVSSGFYSIYIAYSFI